MPFCEALETAVDIVEKGDDKILVHCLAGIGRTGMFLVCLAAGRYVLDTLIESISFSFLVRP